MKSLEKFLPYLVLLYALAVLTNLYTDRDVAFWDFKVYYESVPSNSDNPYDQESFQEDTEEDLGYLTYKYPPLTRYLFEPFAMFDQEVALSIYFVLLLGACALLIYLWNTLFKTGADPWFYVFILLVFNASWFLAMRSGNIAIVLTAAIWLGVYFFTQKKYWQFVACICFAAFFKLTPILLLGLLFFTADRSGRKYALTGGMIMILYLAVNILSGIDITDHFLGSALDTVDETGIVNPNAYALFMDMASYITGKTEPAGYKYLAKIGYVLFTAGVLFFMGRLVTRRYFDKNELSQIEIIVLMIMTYLLILPRVKDYDYVLAVPVVYYVIRSTKISAYPVLIILAVLSSINVILPGMEYGMYLMWNYYPFIILLSAWGLFIYERKGFLIRNTE